MDRREPARRPPVRRGLLVAGALLALALAGDAAAQAAPKPEAPVVARSAKFEPKTQVDGGILQVLFGERALFRLDDGGKPVLEAVERGQLAAAHPPGAASETFAPPGPGLLAAALDGSAEAHVTVLKIWNRTGRPIAYRAIALELLQGEVLRPVPAPTCPVPAGGVRVEVWPAPVVAVGLARFEPASKEALARCAAAAKPAAKPRSKGK
jgi:hypothetical protein